MEWTIVTLLKDGDRVAGAFGYDRERGRFKIFKAKAVVIARAASGRAYKITSNSWEGTGDGIRSPITRAPNCSTWNSSSSIPPA
jgi:succinate dehydrogenase / fumarate reductase flavoprotein subunit